MELSAHFAKNYLFMSLENFILTTVKMIFKGIIQNIFEVEVLL